MPLDPTIILKDKVKQLSLMFGTGTSVTLGAAVSGFTTIESIANGKRFPYSLYVERQPQHWEVGTGLKTGPNTFTRESIKASSNAGAIVNFPVGTKIFGIAPHAELLMELMTTPGPQGIQGIQGNTGDTGATGAPGTTLFSGLTDTAALNQLPEIPTSKITGNFAASRIDAGTFPGARGGLGADASAFSGLLKMVAGVGALAVAETDYATPSGALAAAIATMAAGTNPFSGTTLALTGDITFAASDRSIYRGATQKAQITATQFNILNSNVGIGGSPGELLHIIGASGATGATPPTIRIDSTTDSAAWTLQSIIGKLDFRLSTDVSGAGTSSRASVNAVVEDAAGGSVGLSFYTSNTASALERIRIKANGLVGIGQPIPLELLHIGVDGSAGNRQSIAFGRGGLAAPAAINTASDGDKLILYRNSAIDHSIGVDATGMWLKSYGTGANIRFHVGTTEQMRVDAAGLTMTAASGVYLQWKAGATTHQQGYHDGSNGVIFNYTGAYQIRNTSASGNIQLFTNSLERFRLEGSTGNLFIGNPIATAGGKLDVLATTTQLRLSYDASNFVNFTVSSSGALTIDPSDTNNVILLGTGALAIIANATPQINVTNGSLVIQNATFNAASSTVHAVSMTPSVTPTSGTLVHTSLNVAPAINQTGGANGITRGIYLNPTLTAAADFRALEIANNAHYAIYQSGASALNYLNGKVGIGVTAVGSVGSYSTAVQLEAANSIRASRLGVQTQFIELIPNVGTGSALHSMGSAKSLSIINESASAGANVEIHFLQGVTGSVATIGKWDANNNFLVNLLTGIDTLTPLQVQGRASGKGMIIKLGTTPGNAFEIHPSASATPLASIDNAGGGRFTGLRIDQAPVTESIVPTQTITINVNGVLWKVAGIPA